jgi:hypothetical protein
MELRQLLAVFEPSQPTDAQLLDYCDRNCHVLLCAHDAVCGVVMGGMDFETWWNASRDNWMRGARQAYPRLTAAHYRRFLKEFGEATRHQDSFEILCDVAKRRGWFPPLIHEGGAMSYPAATEAMQRSMCAGSCCREWRRKQPIESVAVFGVSHD